MSANRSLSGEKRTTESTDTGSVFCQGILVEALNPKTAVFFLAFIPQFIDPSQAVAMQFVMLGSLSVALNTAVDVIVVYSAAKARLGFANRPMLIQRCREGFGLIMCGLGATLLFARRTG
jgi:threonine/homoserine/homoserine lactone efflux protein